MIRDSRDKNTSSHPIRPVKKASKPTSELRKTCYSDLINPSAKTKSNLDYELSGAWLSFMFLTNDAIAPAKLHICQQEVV